MAGLVLMLSDLELVLEDVFGPGVTSWEWSRLRGLGSRNVRPVGVREGTGLQMW